MHEVGWSGDFQGGVEELGGFGAECGLQAVPHLLRHLEGSCMCVQGSAFTQALPERLEWVTAEL